jgi:drug/metabolite transporter (DMT)-like permease
MIYFVFTLLFFSSLEIASKPLMGVIDPYILTFYRFLIGFYIIFIAVIAKDKYKEIYKLTKKQVLSLFVLGFINIFFSMSMLQLAVKHTSAATAGVIFCSNPIFIILISVFIKDIKPSFKNIVPVSLGVIGIFLIMQSKKIGFDLGSFYAVLASISFAAFSIIGKKTVKNVSPITANSISFFFGTLVLAFFLIMTKRGLNLPIEVYKTGNLLRFIYIGIGITGIGYLTFFKTLEKFKIVSASYIFILKPLFATIFAIIFLSEKIPLNFWLGLFFIFIGSFMPIIIKKLFNIKD